MINPDEMLKKVELTPPNPKWPQLFVDAAEELKSILQGNCLEIHHIGSTAIPNIYAKAIIDILPVVKNINLIDSLNHKFEKLGYVCMGEYGIPGRRFYWRSKTKRTHHVHIFEEGSSEIMRHIMFKEYLIAHEPFARAYSLIKCALAEVFPRDIENYVNGKASFVQFIDYKTGRARAAQLTAADEILIQLYNPAWPKLAEAEIKVIKKVIDPLPYVALEHLGSTAVPGLSSKPIIDIFVSLKSIKDAELWIKPLETLGYQFWNENPDKEHLRFFKGMPPCGEKRTHHVHLVEESNNTFEHRILFRDILRRDEKIRRQYEALKIKLAKSYLKDREAYTENKGKFIEEVLRAHGYSKPIKR